MRWFLRISSVVLVLLAAYTVWPFVDLYRLSAALEAGDLRAVERHVSFSAIRNSVSRQVLETYVTLTGDDNKVGKFTRNLVIGASTPIAETIIAEDLTPERLANFFAPDESSGLRTSSGRLRLAPMDLRNLWALYASSEYRVKDFHVGVPPTVAKTSRFRLRMRLTAWTWRLVDIQLPHQTRITLAQKIIRAVEKRPQ